MNLKNIMFIERSQTQNYMLQKHQNLGCLWLGTASHGDDEIGKNHEEILSWLKCYVDLCEVTGLVFVKRHWTAHLRSRHMLQGK